MADVRDDDGAMYRSVTITADGCLLIRGQDLGPRVERIFGFGEYEFERRLAAPDVSRFVVLLGLAPDSDLLAAISARFASAGELEDFLKEQAIHGEFWSRIGD